MFIFRVKIVLILICFINGSLPAKILVYVPLPFYSHQAMYRPLWKELASRGHEITLLTTNPMDFNENITQIDLSDVYKEMDKMKFFEIMTTGEQNIRNVYILYDIVQKVVDLELDHPEVKALIEGNDNFDLVIAEFYNLVGTAFARRFSCPLIGVVSMDALHVTHRMLGNPSHPILYPGFDSGLSGKLTLPERLYALAFDFGFSLFLDYVHEVQDDIVKKHFGKNTPSVLTLAKNVSVLFINANPVFHAVRPLNPQTINIGGGFHIEKSKPLAEDLQKYLDNSPQGVIYFSLGTNVKSAYLTMDTKEVILKTFSLLPYKILWKFEKDENDLFDIPKNVNISKWFPQQDILRHPNVKLFITQGGLLSMEEALFFGVPVLAIPFFGDQILNAKKVEEHGFGLILDHKSLDVLTFKNTILRLVLSKYYKNNAVRLSKQLMDQPMTGLERAVWWTEYTIRHKGDVQLYKNPNSSIPYFQYIFLDIFLCAMCFLIGFCIFARLLCKSIVSIFCAIRDSRKIKIK